MLVCVGYVLLNVEVRLIYGLKNLLGDQADHISLSFSPINENTIVI